jgi:hypothetical protein
MPRASAELASCVSPPLLNEVPGSRRWRQPVAARGAVASLARCALVEQIETLPPTALCAGTVVGYSDPAPE